MVLQVVLDIEFGVFFQKLGPMELRRSLANLWIFGPIDNFDGIPIGLRIVFHESFEVRVENSMPSHDVVEVVLE